MKTKESMNQRRAFIEKLAAGAIAASAIALPIQSNAKTGKNTAGLSNADNWFKKAKGEHRLIFDATEPHDGFSIIWSWVFYVTNNGTGIQDENMTGMVVLRHNAIPFALEDRIWKKYNLGEFFQIIDNNSGNASQRNPYFNPKEKDFPNPQIEGIQKLQSRGAMFCVCDMALTFYSSMVAQKMNLSPEEVKADWVSGIYKDIQVVPSGIWAVGRAQKHGFGYCYTGG